MLGRPSTPTKTGRTTSRDGCPPQSFLLIGIPRNAPVECVRYNREMVRITRVAFRSQLLSRRFGIDAVDYSRLPNQSEKVASSSGKKGSGKEKA